MMSKTRTPSEFKKRFFSSSNNVVFSKTFLENTLLRCVADTE